MDRHVLWLRRRIFASIAIQIGLIFLVAFAIAGGLLAWRTDAALMTTVPAAFVAAQALTIGRFVLALRNNPLGYDYLKRYIDSPYRLSALYLSGRPHPESRELLGFHAVGVVGDPTADPSPEFDLFQTVDQGTTAAVSRASGAVSLFSQLCDGRILVTDSRVVVPHEGLAVNVGAGLHPSRLIPAHNKAITASAGGAIPQSDALDLFSRALTLEHTAYCQLGPFLGPFLNLEPKRRVLGRLVATVRGSELASRVQLNGQSTPPRTSPEPASAGRFRTSDGTAR